MYNKVWAILLVAAAVSPAAKKADPKTPPPSALDAYVSEAKARNRAGLQEDAGSIWQSGGLFSDLARDLRASQVDDVVTIVVAENASAVSTGATKTARKSSAAYSASNVFGATKAAGPLSNMLNATGSQALDGQGTTSRQTTLTATVTARVVGVLPNGYLVLEANKNVSINSENQLITVRGVARPADIAADNTVSSNRLAQMEIKINGKGVVNDSIRRPFFLYRLLLGILPF